MTRRCVIHIGPHKTGTSSIQKTLFLELRDGGFEYAKMDRANHGALIHSIFAKGSRTLAFHRLRDRTSDEIADYNDRARLKLAEAIVGSADRTLILSGERISAMSPQELIRMRDFLAKSFAVIDIIGYVRPPAALLQSAFQQIVRERSAALELDQLYRGYRSCFRKFDRVFGEDHTHLYRFSVGEFPGGDVVKHFFSVLKIEPPGQWFRANESLSKPAVQALYAFNKYGENSLRGKGVRRIRNEVVALLVSLRGEKFRLHSDLVRPVLEANRADIRWMEKRIGASLDEPGEDEVGAIRSEADLLDIFPSTIAGLEKLAVTAGLELPALSADRARHAARLVGLLLHSVKAEWDRGKSE